MQKSPSIATRPTLSENLLSSLSASEKSLHAHALDLRRRLRALEAELMADLVEIDESKVFRKLGWSSLFS